MIADEVAALALQLNPASRANIACRLLESLRDTTAPDMAAWVLELSRAEEAAERTFLQAAFPPAVAHACDVLTLHVADDAGLLASLRPFRGVATDTLTDSLSALESLRQAAATGQRIPFSALASATSLVFTVQLWAIDQDGMLRRNKLLDSVQLEALQAWHSEFRTTLQQLLHHLSDQQQRRSLSPR